MDRAVTESLQGFESDAQWLKTRPGEQCRLIRVSSENTQRRYALVEIVSKPGDGTTLHVHEKEDEHMLVLEGTARIANGDNRFNAQAGELVSLRRGIPHAWGNRSNSDLRIVMLISPGGCEEILRLIPKTPLAELPALAGWFHIRALGPTPF